MLNSVSVQTEMKQTKPHESCLPYVAHIYSTAMLDSHLVRMLSNRDKCITAFVLMLIAPIEKIKQRTWSEIICFDVDGNCL